MAWRSLHTFALPVCLYHYSTPDQSLVLQYSQRRIPLQGVFKVAAALPVNYVIHEVEDLFDLESEVQP